MSGAEEGPLKPHEYQKAEFRKIVGAIDGSQARILLVLPTGGGKTIVAVMLCKWAIENQKRVLFFAHSPEMVTQCQRQLIAWGVPSESVGMVLSGHVQTTGAPIQVGSIQTLRNRKKPLADILIVDEAHHTAAKSYVQLLDLYPDASVVGLTATPERGDGQGLETWFDEMLIGPTAEELIIDGHLTAPEGWGVPDRLLPDMDGVPITLGDYEPKTSGLRMMKPELVGNIVETYAKKGGGKTAVVYCVTKAHSASVASEFRLAGYDTELLFGTTKRGERARVLGRLSRGENVVVVTVRVLFEGWDCPAAKCCIIARPTRSPMLHFQMVGRFIRPYNDQKPVILDHVGNCTTHGMPHWGGKEWSLESKRRRPGETSNAPCKVCKECNAIVPAGAAVCQNCGAKFEIRKEPEKVDGELVRLELMAKKRDELRKRLVKFAVERNVPISWVETVMGIGAGART